MLLIKNYVAWDGETASVILQALLDLTASSATSALRTATTHRLLWITHHCSRFGRRAKEEHKNCALRRSG
jgi:hypothetical protein